MLRRTFTVAAVLLLASVSGHAAWEQFHGDVHNSGVSDGGGFSLADMAAPRFVSAPLGLNSLSSPVVMSGRVFAYGDDKVLALDTANGAVLWSSPVAANAMWSWSSPAADSATGSVLAGSGDKLYCFDAATGSQRWQTQIGDVVNSSPLIAGGKVYIHAGGGFGVGASLFALNIADGSIAWSKSDGGAGSAKPAYHDGLVFTTTDFRLCAYDAATGAVAWTSPFTSAYGFFGGISYGNGVLYAPTYNFSGPGTLVAASAADGSLIWERPTPSGDATPAVCSGLVLTSGDWVGPGSTTAHRMGDGSVAWTIPLGGWAFSPTVIDLSAAAGDEYAVLTEQYGSTIALVSLSTGEIAASYAGQGGGPAAIDGGSIYVIGNDGALYAFGPAVPEPASITCLAAVLAAAGALARKRR